MTTATRCPEGDWTYDRHAPCVCVRRPGGWPLIWRDGHLVEPSGSNQIDPSAMALAAHVLLTHPDSGRARAVGPWETYEPLRELNALLGALRPPRWLFPVMLVIGVAGLLVAVVRVAVLLT